MSTLFKTVGAVLCLVVGLCFATPAKADSLYVPAFVCTGFTGFCGSQPTAPDVSFPTPTTMDVTVFGELIVVPLPAGDLPTDVYHWGEVFCGTNCEPFPASFEVFDVTNGEWARLGEPDVCGGDDDTGCGALTFTPVAAPEPGSFALLLAGIGSALAMRKRSARLQQAS